MVGKTLKIVLDQRYEAICATEAKQALAEIAAGQVNVVLLDYYLRDLSGRVVAECAERAGVPVVWMTGAPAALDALTDQRHAYW